MKFVYLTDTHIRLDAPGRRRDANYLKTVLAKIQFVVEYANNLASESGEEVILLHAGDFGDNATWYKNVSAFLDVLEVFNAWNNGVQVITTVGQHDVPNHSIQRWKDSALGLLAKTAHQFYVLTGGDQRFSGHIDNGGWQVRGFGFGEKETKDFLEGKYDWQSNDYLGKQYGNQFKIALVHASVGETETFGWQGIASQNLKGCDLALFGDIHDGFKPYALNNGVVAYSVGSPVRQYLNDKDRTPKFAVIHVDDETHEFEIEELEIPHSRIGDVMDLTPKEDAEAVKFDTAAGFKAHMERMKILEDEPIEDFVRRVGRSYEADDAFIEMVCRGLKNE